MRSLIINELFDNTETKFIPFELREKIDPDFEWTDEIEDQVYYVGSRNIIKSIDKNKDYLYKMRNLLIGNSVEMYHFDHQYGEYEEPVNVLVKHVTYNMLGVICITNIIKKDVYSSYLMDERKPIKIKFKKRIFNELDPYGEEDWGYEYESKKELFVGDEVRIIQDIPGRNRIGSTGIITDFKNNRTQFKVDLTKSVRTHNWIYGEWFPKENLEKIEYSRKEIKEKKKRAQQLKYKMRDIDPYGEEDWLDESKVNENIGHDIKVGDGVICLKGNQDKFEMKDRYGVVLEILYHGAGYLNGILKRGKMYRIRFEDNKIPISFCVFSEIVEPLNPEELKKRREELILKYKDIDPYGEEDWLDESKIIKKFESFNDNKINELFETEKTYEYSFVKKRKMKPFEDFIYTFTSRDKVEYFVTVSINYDNKYMSVKFTDKENYKGFKNKIKDKYSNLDNYDAINVLNTVVKICKDFYDKNKEYINAFETSTLDEKRLRVYKYILGKYFKGWDITHEIDPRGDILIEAKPKKIIENVNHPDLEPINSFIPYTIYKKFNYNLDKYYEYIKDNMEGNLVEFTGVQRGIRDTIVFGEVEKIELSRIGGIVLIQINNVIYSLNVNQPVNIYSSNSEKLKERKRKKEELRLKMMDVDPYGEEDWLDENKKMKTFESFESDKNITELNLSNKGLTKLPDLSNLNNLRELYCHNNQLTELPDYLSNLTNLRVLYCSNNLLTELPDLSNLTNLRELYCHNNQLTELPDLSNLTNLEVLYCFNNLLTELPDLSDLTNLERLYCHNNQLTELPGLSYLTDLRVLSCSNNQLPYNNLDEYKNWLKQNKYTPEEKERIRLSKLNIDPYGEEDWLDESVDHSDIDLYGEEDWDNENEINIGDDVICIKSGENGLLINRTYKVVDIFVGYDDERFLKVKGIDYFWVESRFKKKLLNESHEDIDPYGEEDWDDDNEINIGDFVVCINDYRSGGALNGLINGRKYIVTDKYTRTGIEYFNVKDSITGKNLEHFYITRFKKSPLKESHEDIDPYGEEDWDDDNEIKAGDNLVCLDNEGILMTKGKVYKLLDNDRFGFTFFNDNGDVRVYNKYRFKKAPLNEAHEDIDPYGEENWDLDKWCEGGILVCIDASGYKKILKEGDEYSIIDVGHNWVQVMNKKGEITPPNNDFGVRGWKKSRFKTKN